MVKQQKQDEAKIEMQLRGAVDAGKFDELIEEAIADEKAGLNYSLLTNAQSFQKPPDDIEQVAAKQFAIPKIDLLTK